MYGFAKVTTPSGNTSTSFYLSVNEVLYIKEVSSAEDDSDAGGIVLASESDPVGTSVFFKNGTSIIVNETPEQIFGSVVFVSAPKLMMPTSLGEEN